MLSTANLIGSLDRVIALVDMDCFYVQVEERDDPSIKGVPAAVVQYKAWKGGGIIAVNYEARAKGVTRNMRGDDAKAVCPEIVLVRVPESHGKADLTKYRDAGKEVIDVLCDFSPVVERASIDEAYIDLTEPVKNFLERHSPNPQADPLTCLKAIDVAFLENSFPVGFPDSQSWLESLKTSEILQIEDVKLAVAAEIAGRMRRAVFERTGFRCSAGIAHNKVLAKLGAGMNKPNKQTVIPHDAVPLMYSQTKIKKVRMLGGQFGDILVERFKCEKMSDLLQFSLNQLTSAFGDEKGQWLFSLARGYDDEPVTPRQLPKSIGCSKNFLGPESLDTKEKVQIWIGRLAQEVVERIQRDWELNNRRAKSLTLHVTFHGRKSFSRSCGKNVQYNPEHMATTVWGTMEKLYKQVGFDSIISLGLIASKLEEESRGKNGKILDFYRAAEPRQSDKIRVVSEPEFQPLPGALSESPTELVVPESVPSTKQVIFLEPPVGSPTKLVEATKVRLCQVEELSDDDVDVEAFTPDFVKGQDFQPKNSGKISIVQAYPATPKKSDFGRQDPTENSEITRQDTLKNLDFAAQVTSNNSDLVREDTSKNPDFVGEDTSENSEPIGQSAPKISNLPCRQNTFTNSDPIGQATPTKSNPAAQSKPLFVCSKSPPKIRTVRNPQDPVAALFPTLRGRENSQIKPTIVKPDPVKPGISNPSTPSKSSGGPAKPSVTSATSSAASDDSDYIFNGVDTRTLAKEYLQKCDRCGKAIPLWEILSHKDYHVAFDLQEKYGGLASALASSNSSNIGETPMMGTSAAGQKRPAAGAPISSRGRGSKRGRGKAGLSTRKPTTDRMKTLESYFTPK